MPQKHQRKNFPIDVPHKIAIDLSFDEAQYQKPTFRDQISKFSNFQIPHLSS